MGHVIDILGAHLFLGAIGCAIFTLFLGYAIRERSADRMDEGAVRVIYGRPEGEGVFEDGE